MGDPLSISKKPRMLFSKEIVQCWHNGPSSGTRNNPVISIGNREGAGILGEASTFILIQKKKQPIIKAFKGGGSRGDNLEKVIEKGGSNVNKGAIDSKGEAIWPGGGIPAMEDSMAKTAKIRLPD